MVNPIPPYVAPNWLRGGHAQTIYPLLRRGLLPTYRRERWNTPDGDFIDLDWLPQEVGPDVPLVVLFHGLEGSSASHYARALMKGLKARGWDGVVVHFRGCSGCLNRLPRAYHSGDSDEAEWILKRIRSRFPARPIFAVGVSLGGNVLLKWLGERERAAEQLVDRAVAVCAPVDLAAAGAALQRGFNMVYTRHFLGTLKRSALLRLSRHPGLFDARRMLSTRNLYEFDNVVTAPLHGFRDTDDYWTRASSKPWLRGIRVPTLLINALNDPFLPREALPRGLEISQAVRPEYPGEGGHVGFVSGPFPGRLHWLPRRILAFLESGH